MRRLLLVLLGCLGVLALPATGSGRPDVVGGEAATVAQAPWVVAVGSYAGSCTGSLIDAQHVLTAAHCVFDDTTGQPVAPTSMWVRAGASNLVAPLPGDPNQEVWVSSYRVHPLYANSNQAGPDDLAVLTLATPVTLSAVVQPIALPAPGLTLSSGEVGQFYGYGRESGADEPNWSLNHISLTLQDQAFCGPNDGEDNAVWLCAANPSGSVCFGDSGGGLVLTAPTPTVIAVTTWVQESSCSPGDLGGFANLAAPELADFVRGNDHPPVAPRRHSGPTLDGPVSPAVGSTFTCHPGAWSGSPGYTFTFLDADTRAVLQPAGPSPTYVARSSDVGRIVACLVAVTNAGGTGYDEASAAGPVEAALSSRASSVSAHRGRKATITVTVTGAVDAGSTAVCAPASAIAPAACVTVPPTSVGRHSVNARLRLAIRRTAPLGRHKVRVTSTLAQGQTIATAATVTVLH